MISKDVGTFTLTNPDQKKVRELGGYIKPEQPIARKSLSSEQMLKYIDDSLLALSSETRTKMSIVGEYMALRNQVMAKTISSENAEKELENLNSKYQPIPEEEPSAPSLKKLFRPAKDFFLGLFRR